MRIEVLNLVCNEDWAKGILGEPLRTATLSRFQEEEIGAALAVDRFVKGLVGLGASRFSVGVKTNGLLTLYVSGAAFYELQLKGYYGKAVIGEDDGEFMDFARVVAGIVVQHAPGTFASVTMNEFNQYVRVSLYKERSADV